MRIFAETRQGDNDILNLADRRNSSSQLCIYFSNILNIFMLSAAMLKKPWSWKHKLCCMTPFQCNREVFVETIQLNWTLHWLLKHKKKAMCFLYFEKLHMTVSQEADYGRCSRTTRAIFPPIVDYKIPLQDVWKLHLDPCLLLWQI